MNYSSEESRLAEQVRRSRRRIGDKFNRTIIQDGKVRRARGEIYVDGEWVPKEFVERVSRRLTRSTLVGFVEFHLAVLVALGLLKLFWFGFEWLLLPLP